MTKPAVPAALLTLTTPMPCWHESRHSARFDPLVSLSMSAAFIATDRPLPPGTLVYLELDLDGGGAAIDAIASNSVFAPNDQSGFGVEFITVDERALELLEARLGQGPHFRVPRTETATIPTPPRPALLDQPRPAFEEPAAVALAADPALKGPAMVRGFAAFAEPITQAALVVAEPAATFVEPAWGFVVEPGEAIFVEPPPALFGEPLGRAVARPLAEAIAKPLHDDVNWPSRSEFFVPATAHSPSMTPPPRFVPPISRTQTPALGTPPPPPRPGSALGLAEPPKTPVLTLDLHPQRQWSPSTLSLPVEEASDIENTQRWPAARVRAHPAAAMAPEPLSAAPAPVPGGVTLPRPPRLNQEPTSPWPVARIKTADATAGLEVAAADVATPSDPVADFDDVFEVELVTLPDGNDLRALRSRSPQPGATPGFDDEIPAAIRPLPDDDDDPGDGGKGVVDVDFSEFEGVMGTHVTFRSQGPPPSVLPPGPAPLGTSTTRVTAAVALPSPTTPPPMMLATGLPGPEPSGRPNPFASDPQQPNPFAGDSRPRLPAAQPAKIGARLPTPASLPAPRLLDVEFSALLNSAATFPPAGTAENSSANSSAPQPLPFTATPPGPSPAPSALASLLADLDEPLEGYDDAETSPVSQKG